MDLDVGSYFARIGYDGSPRVALDTLKALHLAHVTGIPFENLDIFLGRPIRIDVPSVHTKLVRLRRGGYCYEHNTLFAAVLEAVGFRVTRLAARVGTGDPRRLKRTHMILGVETGGQRWLCDVGFGAGGVFEPIPLEPGDAIDQFGHPMRVSATPWGFSLFDADRELYQFTLEEIYEPDYVLANHYTSTHPDSGFVRTLTAQRRTVAAQLVLRNWSLTETSNGAETVTTIPHQDALIGVLSERFEISLPPGTRFRPPGGGGPGPRFR